MMFFCECSFYSFLIRFLYVLLDVKNRQMSNGYAYKIFMETEKAQRSFADPLRFLSYRYALPSRLQR